MIRQVKFSQLTHAGSAASAGKAVKKREKPAKEVKALPKKGDGFQKSEEPADKGFIKKQVILAGEVTPDEKQGPKDVVLADSPEGREVDRQLKQGVKRNPNGTIAVLDDPPSQKEAVGEPGVNFAQLFGVETEPKKPSIPQNFSRQEVESHYFKKGVEEAKGPDDLTPEGSKLYKGIRKKYLDSVPYKPYGTPALYMTGGLPGSGKGFILGKVLGDKPQHVLVDPDEIKKDILKDLAQKNPQMRGQMEQDKKWGNVVHETSSFMAKRLMQDALFSKKDIIFDSSMASKNVGKYRGYAERARQNNYRVVGIISDVTVGTAIERAYKRADKPTKIPMEDGSTLTMKGRLTEPDYIKGCKDNLDKNLRTYIGEAMYDKCVVFDNNSSENPAQVKAIYTRMADLDGKVTSRLADRDLTAKQGKEG